MTTGRPPLAPGAHGEPWVRASPRGFTATVYYRDVGGTTRKTTRSGKTAKAARAAVLDAARQASGASGSGALTGSMRFRDAAAVWLEHKAEAGVRGSTLDRYHYRLSIILPEMGALRLNEITPGRVRTVFDRLAPGRAVSTLRAYRVVIEGVLRLAARYDAIPAGSAAVDALGGRRHTRKMPRSLTRAEAGALVDTLRADQDAPWYVARLAQVQIGTGLRICEALALRWGDLHLDGDGRARAVVAGNVTVVRGKGVVRHEGKTAAAIRTIILPEFVALHLRAWRGSPPLPDGLAERPVFASPSGEWLRPEPVSRALRAALNRAGYEWVVSHTFRKTAATILDDEGVPVRKIADQLGHSSTRITSDVYLGRQQDDESAAAALEKAWGTGEQ